MMKVWLVWYGFSAKYRAGAVTISSGAVVMPRSGTIRSLVLDDEGPVRGEFRIDPVWVERGYHFTGILDLSIPGVYRRRRKETDEPTAR